MVGETAEPDHLTATGSGKGRVALQSGHTLLVVEEGKEHQTTEKRRGCLRHSHVEVEHESLSSVRSEEHKTQSSTTTERSEA